MTWGEFTAYLAAIGIAAMLWAVTTTDIKPCLVGLSFDTCFSAVNP